MPKFMPGPYCTDYSFGIMSVSRKEGRQQRICTMEHESGEVPPSIEATGILFAAAPDLYEALEAMTAAVKRISNLSYWDEGAAGIDSDYLTELLKQARAALAKAKGE